MGEIRIGSKTMLDPNLITASMRPRGSSSGSSFAAVR